MTLRGALQVAKNAAQRMDAPMYVVAEGRGWQVYQGPAARLTPAQLANVGAHVAADGTTLRSL